MERYCCFYLLTVNDPRYRSQRTIAIIFILVPLLLTIPILVSVDPAFSAADNSPVVRLLLGDKLPRAVVSGASLVIEERDDSTWKPVFSRIRMLVFSPMQEGVRLVGSGVVASVFRIRSVNGMLEYDGHTYRGYLTVSLQNNGLTIVSHMPLESYLIGVVNGEIDSSWPMDAVMAQVIAARSYALFQVNTGSPYFDLKTDITDQVYAGVESEDERAKKAVAMTRGQVLYGEDGLIQAYFHSSCGGNTSSAREVWGFGQAQLKGVYCGQCGDAPYARWNLSPDPRELESAVRTLYPEVEAIRSLGIHKRSTDGRVRTLFVDTPGGRVLIDAGEFRKAMGYKRLPSTRFSLKNAGSRIIVTGEGYGHGVGLCQWGARGSAIRGMNYRQILAKYYPGTEIRRAY